jgi:superfamily II helicase
MENERKMSLLCKIIGHKWKNVIETAVFSQTTYFHECSRCLITKEAEISEQGFVIKYAVTEIRPKEDDNFSGETTIESVSLQDIQSIRKKFKNLNQVQSLSDLESQPGVYQTLTTIDEQVVEDDLFEKWGLEKESLDPEIKKFFEDAGKALKSPSWSLSFEENPRYILSKSFDYIVHSLLKFDFLELQHGSGSCVESWLYFFIFYVKYRTVIKEGEGP